MRRRAAALVPLAAILLLVARAAEAQSTTYIAFGDSITAGVGDDPERAEPGYPPRLQALLTEAGAQAIVLNRGVGGERTPEGVTRIDSVLAQGGDVLLLMEGSNDISRQISVETTQFNLDLMARKAEQRGILPIHATVIPRIPRASVDSDNLINQTLNEQIRELAGIRDRGLVDNFEAFGKIDDLFDKYYWTEPTDFVGHPNPDGYDVMAKVFFDVLTDRDTTPPVEGLIVPANGARKVPSDESIFITLWDFGAGIDLANTDLLVNDEDVNVVPEGDAKRAELRYDPPNPLANVVRVRLRSRDLATPPNTVDREIARFVIAGTVFLQGDFDESGRVDGADLVTFALSFGALRGQSRYRSKHDFNQDGIIDGDDLAIVAANFGKSSF
jgi:lysophospholipase L1-like esterase